MQLIHLISQTWSSKACAEDLCDRPLIFIESGMASQFSSDGKTTTVTRIPALDSSQEETDTRIILYLHYCRDSGADYARVKTKDSNVFFLLLFYAKQLRIKIILDTGGRLINITDIAEDYTDEWCAALLGLHAFTGCDSTSSFPGKGNLRPLKVLQNASKFAAVLTIFGNNWELDEKPVKSVEEFVCVLFGHMTIKKVNEVIEIKLKKVCGSRWHSKVINIC